MWRSYDKISGPAAQGSGFVKLRCHSKDEQASYINAPSQMQKPT
jgi:hypothetical protein